MTVRGGGVPASKPWLLCRGKEWVRRLGASPPMRMTASWSGPWTHRIQGCGAIDTRPHAGSPLNVIPTTSIGPPCSELSRHGLANAERVERLVRRPTLTAPARAGFAMLRVENEETDSRSNKETDQESKKDRRSDRLTIKTPYKVWRGQRLGGHSWRHLPIPRYRDRAMRVCGGKAAES